LVAGLIAIGRSAGPGKGGNLGAAMLGVLCWLLAFACGVASIVTLVLVRRMDRQRRGSGFEVISRPLDQPSGATPRT